MRPSQYRRLSADLSATDLSTRGAEWRWLNAVAFFSAASYGIGAALFVVGAATSMAVPALNRHNVPQWKERVLIDYAYAIGGCYFTIGSYLGHYAVINVGREASGRFWFVDPSGGTSASGYWGSLIYFIGACSFQVSVSAMLFAPTMEPSTALWLSVVPQVVGGLCFTLAAVIEQMHNADATWRETVFWVCTLYLAGSVLFFAAAATGLVLTIFVDESSETAVCLGVDLPYLVGSAMFLIGAWAQLQMWKAEQFGLGFIREINHTPRVPRATASDSSLLHHSPLAATPTGADTAVQNPIVEQLSLAAYMANGVLSALNVSLSWVWHAHADSEMLGLQHAGAEALLESEELLSDMTSFVAAHGMLLLATAVHFTPTLQPYGHLLWLMRGIAVLLLAASALRCVKYLYAADVQCNAAEQLTHELTAMVRTTPPSERRVDLLRGGGAPSTS